MRNDYPKTMREARENTRPRLSQERLAAQLLVTRPAVCLWENNKRKPHGPSRILLAQALNVPLETVNDWFAEKEAA